MSNKNHIDIGDLFIVVVCLWIVYASVILILKYDRPKDNTGTSVDESVSFVEEIQEDVTIPDPVEEIVEPVVETIDDPALDVEPPRAYFDVPLEQDLQDHIFDICEYYSIDPAIAVAMIERESRFRESAIGDSNKSFGLMQIQVKWHMERMDRLGMHELLDPYQNVVVGIDFIHELLGYGNGMTWALMAYNGGPSYANSLSRKGIVSDYASEVIIRAHELRAV